MPLSSRLAASPSTGRPSRAHLRSGVLLQLVGSSHGDGCDGAGDVDGGDHRH